MSQIQCMIQSLSDNGTELTSNAILRAGALRLPNTAPADGANLRVGSKMAVATCPP